MNAKETIMYLYGHGHIPSSLHFKTIMEELEKPITDHPDVHKLISQMVVLQTENKSLKYAIKLEKEIGRKTQAKYDKLEEGVRDTIRLINDSKAVNKWKIANWLDTALAEAKI